MRLRLGFVVGFGTGYYLGAKAGRERYEEINRAIAKIKRSERFEVAAEKAKEMVDQGVEQAKDLAQRTRGDGDGDDTAGSPYRPVTPGP